MIARIFIMFLLTAFAVIAVAQTQTEEEKLLEKILPSSFEDYKPDGAAMTLTSRAQEQSYVISSRTYKKGSLEISIAMFDYKMSPEVLKRYTSSWNTNPIDDSTTMVSSTIVNDMPAFQHYDKTAKAAQLYIHVKNRYLVYITGNGHTPEFLKSVSKLLKLGQLPE